MITLRNYYCIVILLLCFKITISKIDNSETNYLDSNGIDDYSVSDDEDEDDSGLDIHLNDDVCELPIDKGNCSDESRSVSDIGRFFGYNTNTKKCEEFIYDGCGDGGNRFRSINECWKTCFTPLNYFLAKVKQSLKYRFSAFNLSAAFRNYLHFRNDESGNTK